jgi:hypothetical protein
VDAQELLLYLVRIKDLYYQLINRHYLVDRRLANINKTYTYKELSENVADKERRNKNKNKNKNKKFSGRIRKRMRKNILKINQQTRNSWTNNKNFKRNSYIRNPLIRKRNK